MIRIGMLGAGPMGAGNARAFGRLSERCRIVGVADLNDEAAHKIADSAGATVHRDYREMLAGVDAVVISTPNFLHADQAVACAEGGKHVFIEKPMAISVADADRIVAAVDKARVASFVGFSVRFGGVQHTMQQRLASGELGALRSIWSRRMGFAGVGAPNQPPRVSWRSDIGSSGGVMHELLAHEIDWEMSLAGTPTHLFCRKMSRTHDDPRQNDHVWIMMGFGPEATGTIEGSQMGTIDEYYWGLMAEKGSLYTEKWGGDLYLQVKKGDREKLEPLAGFDKHANFLDAIEGKAKSVADVHWGRKVVYVAEKAIESAISGQAIKLDVPA